MKIGIAGLSASGKSTIFSSFLGGMESSGAKKSTSGVVNVPDERLERFTAMFNPKKTVYATVIFEDLLPLDTHAKNDRIKLADRLKIMDALVLVVGAYRCVDGEDALK